MKRIFLWAAITTILLSACLTSPPTATPTTVFTVTPLRPSATADSAAATFEAMVAASATAVKLTANAPTSTPTLPSSPTTPPTVTLEQPTGTPTLPATNTPQAAAWGQRTKTSGCVASGGLPDSACTPGDIFSTATKDQICVSGYSSSVRNVSESEKEQVYAEYGIASHTAGEYEVDHLISLELGGSNDVSNLWPEAASPKPGFHEKDGVEDHLHSLVCSGAVTLAEAQREIAPNWLAVYAQMKGAAAVPTAAVKKPLLPQPTTAQPTAVPQPTAAQPPAQPTPANTAAVAPGLTVLMLTSPVAVNANATLQIQTVAGASCFLTYYTPKGSKSTATGLGATTANGNGVCTWSWKIGPSTTPGTGKLTVTGNGLTRSLPIVIQ
jgi:hypothetical protein